jgi:hypothetical protein
VEALTGPYSMGELLALRTNFRQGCKCLTQATNTLAYYGYVINYDRKSFMAKVTGVGLIKLLRK